MRVAALLTALFLVAPAAPPRPTLDAQDRAAFLAWFTLLADAQFYRADSDVTDCAALVRHAAREALRDHTPEWQRRIAIPGGHVRPALRAHPIAAGDSLPLFRVSDTTPARYAEFADARTILRLNASLVSRDAGRGQARRPAGVPAGRPATARAPDGVRGPVGVRAGAVRLGGLPHRPRRGRRRSRRDAEGVACRFAAASVATLAPGSPATPRFSGSTD